MNIYAYVGIIEALGKLGIAYAISISPIEKLVWYALLTAALQLLVAFSYRIYCIRNYSESKISRLFSRDICKSMLKFSGWSLIANVSQILSTQGLIVLINMFFAPAIAAAQAIGNQISTAMTQFSSNFMTAINPQVIKLYSKGEREASRRLNLQTTILVWDLMMLIGLPLIVCMNPIINLWLTDVPPYAIIFSQYIIISQIINTFSMTFYIPMIASGELRDNSMAALWSSIFSFGFLYYLLQQGFDVMWVQYLTIIQAIILGFVVKPYILCKKIDYNVKEMLYCYGQCLKSAIFPILICIIISNTLKVNDKFGHAIMAIIFIIFSVAISSFVCMKRTERQLIVSMIRKRIASL